MKYLKPTLRVVLGLIYLVYGLNGFLHFLPKPSAPPAAWDFFNAMLNSGYFMPVLKGTQLICGISLLSGFYVPLSLIVLAPVTLQIWLFHLFLDPDHQCIPILMMMIHLMLGWFYRDSYRELFKAK